MLGSFYFNLLDNLYYVTHSVMSSMLTAVSRPLSVISRNVHGMSRYLRVGISVQASVQGLLKRRVDRSIDPDPRTTAARQSRKKSGIEKKLTTSV